MLDVDNVKLQVQVSARAAWIKAHRRGTLGIATGVGKTKIAIDEIIEIFEMVEFPRILIIIPTQVLRDTDWPEEISKWYSEPDDLMKCIRAECYASLHKIEEDEPWDLVIFDECHHITAANSVFFKKNRCKAIMGLTATPPDHRNDYTTYELVREFMPLCFTYTLTQALHDGIVADFMITVIKQPMDGINKNIVAGNKAKRFMTTEVAHYQYLEKRLKAVFAEPPGPRKYANIDFATRMRMHFIMNLESKTTLARRIIEHYTAPERGLRSLIFCGSIDQCEKLCAPYTWHSKNKKKKPNRKEPNPVDNMDHFRDGGIDTLGVVAAANEGVNIPLIDFSLIVQCNSKEREMIQRIGRAVRKRPDYTAEILVMVAEGTQDENWAKSSLAGFPQEKIKWTTAQDFVHKMCTTPLDELG